MSRVVTAKKQLGTDIGVASRSPRGGCVRRVNEESAANERERTAKKARHTRPHTVTDVGFYARSSLALGSPPPP